MPGNKNIRVQNAHTIRAPPPSLPCPDNECRRHFHSRSGRTNHIRAKHPELYGNSRLTPPLQSPSPSHSLNSNKSGSSPIVRTPTPEVSGDENATQGNDNANDGLFNPPPSPVQSAGSPMPQDHPHDVPEPNLNEAGDTHSTAEPPRAGRTYHRKINGASFIVVIESNILSISLIPAKICDEQGGDLPANTPPPPRPSNRGPKDWLPYKDRVEFELADFLYRRNQMSGGDIDFILNLWAASLAPHGDKPPFDSHTDLYNKIDSTPLGDIPWESFSLKYGGTQPDKDTPSWMKADHDVWFRDPRSLVHNLLSNPDFKDEIDYAPFQEYTADGVHRFRDFMSGDWAWQQAVSFCSCIMLFSNF